MTYHYADMICQINLVGASSNSSAHQLVQQVIVVAWTTFYLYRQTFTFNFQITLTSNATTRI